MNRQTERKLDLIVLLTQKEFSLKYKRTALGVLWSLLNPVLTSLVFFVAFKIFMRFKIDNYTFFLLSALFPWSWFASSIIISARSLVDNVTLIKKVIFPRHYLVASVIFAQLVILALHGSQLIKGLFQLLIDPLQLLFQIVDAAGLTFNGFSGADELVIELLMFALQLSHQPGGLGVFF